MGASCVQSHDYQNEKKGMMMKQIMILVVGLLLLAGPVSAATVTYSWEDGETILGSYSAITATNDTTIAHSGNSSLELVDGGASGTPQAYVAGSPVF